MIKGRIIGTIIAAVNPTPVNQPVACPLKRAGYSSWVWVYKAESAAINDPNEIEVEIKGNIILSLVIIHNIVVMPDIIK